MEILGFREFNEKLDIQPITKERLGRGVNGIKRYVTMGSLDWTSSNVSTLVDNSGNPLKKGIDYYEHNGDIYYTKDGAFKVVPNGWRIPTSKDFDNLVSVVGLGHLYKLISKECGGTDQYGFGIRLLGFYSSTMPFDGNYNGYGSNADFVLDAPPPQNDTGSHSSIFCMMVTYSSSANWWKLAKTPIHPSNGMSLRFVRNH